MGKVLEVDFQRGSYPALSGASQPSPLTKLVLSNGNIWLLEPEREQRAVSYRTILRGIVTAFLGENEAFYDYESCDALIIISSQNIGSRYRPPRGRNAILVPALDPFSIDSLIAKLDINGLHILPITKDFPYPYFVPKSAIALYT